MAASRHGTRGVRRRHLIVLAGSGCGPALILADLSLGAPWPRQGWTCGPREGAGPVREARAARADDKPGLPIVRQFTDTRRRAVVLRLKEAGCIDGWKAALACVRDSSFLRGGTPGRNGQESFACNFDFLVNRANFTKIMEGNYRDRHGPGPDGGPNDGSAALRAFADSLKEPSAS
jgi:hypothetical protein